MCPIEALASGVPSCHRLTIGMARHSLDSRSEFPGEPSDPAGSGRAPGASPGYEPEATHVGRQGHPNGAGPEPHRREEWVGHQLSSWARLDRNSTRGAWSSTRPTRTIVDEYSGASPGPPRARSARTDSSGRCARAREADALVSPREALGWATRARELMPRIAPRAGPPGSRLLRKIEAVRRGRPARLGAGRSRSSPGSICPGRSGPTTRFSGSRFARPPPPGPRAEIGRRSPESSNRRRSRCRG